MIRLGSLVFCAMFIVGVAVHGCGSNTPGGGTGGAGGSGPVAIETIVPADNAVPGWARDPSEPKVANKVAAIANDYTTAVDYIDGGADPFYTATFAPTVFAWQNYITHTVTSSSVDGFYTLKLYVLQMPSAAQATALYDSVMDGTHSLYSTNTWSDMSLGDKARITNSATDWWINFRKGIYYCEVRLTYAEVTDLAGKQQTIDFATYVASKM